MVDWNTDGGVYLGRRVASPLSPEQQRALSPNELRQSPTTDEPLRGIWQELSDDIRYGGDRHLFTLGPNGSGKTRLLLLPNLVKLPNWSVLVVDPKGSLAAQTAPFRITQKGHSVHVIDPFSVLATSFPEVLANCPALQSCGFNPLATLDPDSERFNDDAGNMARAIIKTDGLQEKHWAQSAQSLVKGLMMAIRVAYGKEAQLAELRAIVTAPDKLVAEICASYVIKYQKAHPAIAAALNRFTKIEAGSRELLSILSTTQTQTDWLDSPNIQKSLSGRALDFGRLKESPTTVYLILPPEELETQSVWLRLLIAAALRPLLRSVRPARVPVLFMLDEFAQLGHMEVIEKNLGLMREYGVKLWPILQDLGQMKDLYERRWESFIANAGMLHAFAPQDATTRDYISKLSGERLYWTTVFNRSTGTNFGGEKASGNEGTSTSAQSTRGPVYWPQHLAAIRFGKAVLFSQGHSERVSFPQPEKMSDVSAALRLSGSDDVDKRLPTRR